MSRPLQGDGSDLVDIPSSLLSDDRIYEALKDRHSRELPFSRIGSNALVVTNPGRMLQTMNDSTAKKYAEEGYKSTNPSASLAPHIYETATKAYYALRRRGEDQALLFSGISGSGKSEAARSIVRQLCLVSAKSKKDAKIHSQIQLAQSLLDAFGSARTLLNPNASFYNTFQELQYNERGRIIGCKWLTFGFQKTRVSSIPANERSFHSFYALLSGTTPEERQKWKLKDSGEFTYLAQSKCVKVVGVDDSMKFAEMLEAMKALSIKNSLRSQIFKLMALILNLGDILFEDQGDQEACTVKNYDQLETCAELFGVPASSLATALTYQTKLVGSELCTVFMDAATARIQRDNFANTLYALIFSWIVEFINQKLCKTEDEFANVIILLDVQGYRAAPQGSKNSPGKGDFELFCANYVSERCQWFNSNQAFQSHVETQMNEENRQLPRAMFVDNSACIELLRGSAGTKEQISNSVLGVLEACSQTLEGKKDMKALTNYLNKEFAQHPNFTKQTDGASFGIVHCFGQQTYADSQFLNRNADGFPPDFINLARKSTSEFMVELFESLSLSTEAHPRHQKTIAAARYSSKPTRQPSRKYKRAPQRPQSEKADDVPTSSVLRQIDQTLSELFATIDAMNTWNVMCLRPSNEDPSNWVMSGGPVKIEAKYYKNQLNSLLIIDLIRQREMDGDYVVALNFDEFMERYNKAIEPLNLDPNRSIPQKIQALSTISGWDNKDLLIGEMFVYMREKAWKGLEDSIRQAEKDERIARKGMSQGGDRGASIYADSDAGSQWGGDDSASRVSEDEYLAMRGRAQYAESEYGESEYGQSENSRELVLKNIRGNETDKKEVEQESVEEIEITRQRKMWLCCVKASTWWIPSALIARCGMKRPDVQLAWREKVTLCIMIFWISAVAISLIVVLPLLLCPPVNQYAPEEFSYHQGTSTGDDIWMGIYGKVYDLSSFAKQGHGASATSNAVTMEDMRAFAGQDVSYLFPMPLTESCKGLVTDRLVTVDNNKTLEFAQAAHYSGSAARDPTSKMAKPNWFQDRVAKRFNRKEVLKGDIAFEPSRIQKDYMNLNRKWAILGNEVFDLTFYFETADKHPVKMAGVPNYEYLGDGIKQLFTLYGGKDITEEFKAIKPASQQPRILSCLRNTFKVGVVDTRKSIKCQVSDYLLLGTAMLLVAVILVKFLAALQLGTRRAPEDHDRFVICQVPCYTEGEDSLRKTIDSLAGLRYDDKRKLIFIICDGMIVGGGNDRPTPRIVLDILGVDPSYDPEPLAFYSVAEGSKQLNYGKVYSGLYEFEGHVVPYLVVVKVGRPSETSRPGNRGKRDSQIILLRFLNRVQAQSEMSPLELEIYHQMKNVIGVNPNFYEYILMVDADTEVMEDSLNRLISCMKHDQRIVGICGETALQEEELSWATMIQVYEYYISHHMAKAFESLFGSVTCLPGCFCMYRIRTSNSNRPLIVHDNIVLDYSENRVDTLHKKNLLHLGEDRYLTTLMLKHFPEFKMTFTQDAMCKTAAPEKWSILLSQRRRWINSTIHNLFELMLLPNLCGFCCFSMRFVVFFDLFGTLVQPSMLIYLCFLIYKVIENKVNDQPQGTNLVSLIIIAAVFGLQAFIFIIKRQWQHIGWMVIYLLATPIFSFAIPLYSFWHFDDFSWGNTRVVLGENNKVKIITQEEEKFDPKMIPLKKWSVYEQEMWEMGSVVSKEDRPQSRMSSQYSQYGYGQQGMERASYVSYQPADRMSHYSQQGRLSHYAASNRGSQVVRDVTDEEIRDQVYQIIQGADLMTITKKQVREQVSQVFGMDLSHRREFINQCIEQALAS